MKTPNLLDVPKDSPSNRQKLAAFKAKHGIETHCDSDDKDRPWLGLHMPSARQYGYGVTAQSDMVDCIAKVGRLLDESGALVSGRTEREAVRNVCGHVGIPFTL